MRQTRATSAPEQGATKKNDTIITSVSESSLLDYERLAATSERGRVLRGIRTITAEGVQREQIGPNSPHQAMINTLQRRTYVPPHKHPEKWEQFSLEEVGKNPINVICFDENGKVSKVVPLSPGPNAYFTVPVGVYHSVVAFEDGTQFEEIKPGEYQGDEREKKSAPADWAPAENSPERFEFRRWLEICKPGDEARHYKAILAAHDGEKMAEIVANQEILSKIGEVIKEQNEAIKQNQAMLLQLQAQNALKQAGTQAMASSEIIRDQAPSPEQTATCSVGFWPFWSAPAKSSPGVKQSSPPPVSVTVNAGTINFNFFGLCPQRSEAPGQSRMGDDGQMSIIPRDASDSQTDRCSLLGF